jgi:putative (di)nucleoside polyphosphate hydrolase
MQINISGSHREFREWRWKPMEAVVQDVVPFKRGVYQTVAEEFQHLLTQ